MTDERELRLDNPMLVRWEFASEERLATRNAIYGQLEAHFPHVDVREAEGVVVFPDPDAMRQFVAADMTRAHLAANVPAFDQPVPARSHHTVFVAEKV